MANVTENSGSSKTAVIAAVECTDAWGDGTRKVRIKWQDLLPGSEQEVGKGTAFTGEDLRRALIRRVLESIRNGTTPRNHADDGTSIDSSDVSPVVDVYDDDFGAFVSLTSESLRDVDVAPKFGRLVRCIVHLGGSKELHSPNKDAEPLAIMGRFFPYDSEGMEYDGKHMVVKEVPNNQIDGTGLNVWDGAILLARYLELQPERVRGKRVLELGSGSGLVGIASGILGASEVVLTDLQYTLSLMRENVERNEELIASSGCHRIECKVCDWFCPPAVNEFGFSCDIADEDGTSSQPDIIIIADCVWVEELVAPLLQTLEGILCECQSPPKFLISYQRRGKAAHDAFWPGLHALFDTVVETNTSIAKPDVLFLLECRNERRDLDMHKSST